MKKTIILVASAALLVPAAALASQLEVSGPASIVGRGPVHGGLNAASASTVNFRFRAANVRISGKARDLKVTCNGRRAKLLERPNRRGIKVVGCIGRGLQVAVTATSFRFAARSHGAYGIQIPEGVRGVLYGNFREDARPQPEDERPAEDAEPVATR
jgi:hypothetical protein